MPDARRWQNLWVRLAVALAFADASIVVLALPQIVARLHTSISHAVWVIVGYNVALIAGSALIVPFGRRLATTRALVAGLVLFGASSLGCGASDALAALIPFRIAQGFGGALILASSLPLFAGSARPGDSPLIGWSAAAAVGAALGPSAGGVLTQLFSWRSIFFAQAPVAAVAILAVIAARPQPVDELEPESGPETAASGRIPPLAPLPANAALTLLSAGLIGALFLVVIELISAWLVSPIGAAAIVLTIPVATALAERVVRGHPPIVLGAIGSVLVAIGLAILALISHRQLGWVVLALALCGSGLGLGFPGLTSAALRTAGSATARAAKTVAARDAGLVVGLLVLTPIFVDRLTTVSNQATPPVTAAVLFAPVPTATKLALAPGLEAAAKTAPQSELPNFHPVFARVAAQSAPQVRPQLTALEHEIDVIVQNAATHAFRRPYEVAALFALLVVPLLGAWVLYARRRGVTPRGRATG